MGGIDSFASGVSGMRDEDVVAVKDEPIPNSNTHITTQFTRDFFIIAYLYLCIPHAFQHKMTSPSLQIAFATQARYLLRPMFFASLERQDRRAFFPMMRWRELQLGFPYSVSGIVLGRWYETRLGGGRKCLIWAG